MKYIELLNGFREIENKLLQEYKTTQLYEEFIILCSSMVDPVKCNIITYGDTDQERSEFLSYDKISGLVRLRNKLSIVFGVDLITASKCFALTNNIYSTINDWCVDYIIDVCKAGPFSWMAEFCNILTVASDLIYDWINPDSLGIVLDRHDGVWDGWKRYSFINAIYRQEDSGRGTSMEREWKEKSAELFETLDGTLSGLNVLLLERNKNLWSVIKGNKQWIDTLASRYMKDSIERGRKGYLIESSAGVETNYNHCRLMLGLIWEKLGYEKVRY